MFDLIDWKVKTILGLSLLVIALGGAILYLSLEEEEEGHPPLTVKTIVVHIEGEVINPGVYEIQEGLRLYELIALAGGKTAEANTTTLNLAMVLSDQAKITIPRHGEEGDSEMKDGLVNINTASLETLKTLHNIGDSRAKAIISYRNTHGPFLTIEDILKVNGIGPTIYEGIKDAICV